MGEYDGATAKAVLSLQAHPDDAEFLCAGTLSLLHEKGWEVHIATMTPGDCGSAEYGREEISRIRRAEAAESVRILDGRYHCLECDDVFILYDKLTLRKAIRLLRIIQPTLVFAPSPSDYMIDHEITSKIAQTACFACGMPNIETEGTEPFEPVPYLYYVDALEGKDKFGSRIEPGIRVDISAVIETKEKMLCCHESQRSWLMTHHGMDAYVLSMKRFSEQRGNEISRPYAEGFRQHLGHGYPQDNLLKSILGDLVHERKEYRPMARKQSILAPDWWDYTTLDDEILNDAARLTPEDMLSLSREGFTVIFYDTFEDFYLAEALEYIHAWRQATADNPVGICGPIGPTEQLPLVARLVNELKVNLQDAHFWGMDEWYLDGREVEETHPLSFARADMELCFNRIHTSLKMPVENIHFPKADTSEYIQSWEGVRCAVMQGGQGDIKHWAFNDPVRREGKYADRPPSPEEYRQLTTRVVELHPVTVMQNARTSGGGVVTGVPMRAITVGPVQT